MSIEPPICRNSDPSVYSHRQSLVTIYKKFIWEWKYVQQQQHQKRKERHFVLMNCTCWILISPTLKHIRTKTFMKIPLTCF